MSRARNTLVTLERFTKTKDEYNQPIEDWQSIGQEWAETFYGRGDERRQAAMEQSSQPIVFQFHSNALTRSLTTMDRLQADAATWNIRGIAPDTPRRGQIEISATREG